jgi:AraC-like DNA-binding protein
LKPGGGVPIIRIMQEQLDQLRALAARHAQGPRVDTAIARVAIATGLATTGILPGLCDPKVCVVLQGAKEVMIGDHLLRYDPASYFIASMELPVSGRIVQASAERPYIALSMALDWQGLATLLPEMPAAAGGPAEAFGVSPVTPELLDPFLRLMRLLDRPRDIPVLAPLLEREIHYRLLQGPQGRVLRQIALANGRMSQIRQAIAWIRQHYDQPMRIETLTGLAGMSAASFHRHFREATAMSPLQYQKMLRLQQARRLLIADHDATRAGFAVGYESASQFSREYARLFGAPPARDAIRLREEAAGGAEMSNAA